MQTEWTMPAVRSGDVVEYFKDGLTSQGEGIPAFVTRVYPRAVDMTVFPVNGAPSPIPEPARHADDPDLERFLTYNPGCGAWRHRKLNTTHPLGCSAAESIIHNAKDQNQPANANQTKK